MAKCNDDCFNCKFPDCIKEYSEMSTRYDRRAYYIRNRERLLKYQNEYNRVHRPSKAQRAAQLEAQHMNTAVIAPKLD